MSLPLQATGLAMLCAASVASAVEVQVKNPWVRSAAEGEAAAPAYVDLRSDTPLKLVGASSAWAQRIEIRAVELRDEVATERTVPVLDVPSAAEVRLAPGGNYLALVNVRRAFGNGDFVPITLRFEDAQRRPHSVALMAQARGLLLPQPPAAKPE